MKVTEGPGGVLIVVLRPSAVSTLRGRVRSSPALAAMPGIAVKVLETGQEAVTGADGTFAIGGVKPGSYTVEARARGFAIQKLAQAIVAGEVAEVSFILQPLLTEDIVVQPSRISLMLDEPATPISLSREEIQALPHLGDDVFRTLSLLPGTASSDFSAQFHIRGARRDELLIVLDGQELYEPYHLRDFDNALSIVGASFLGGVQLSTAAFPVSYGDRMAGVLNMETVTPPGERLLRLGASFHGAQIEAADTHYDGKVGWLVSLRRGSTDLLGRAFNLEAPRFWDMFGKLNYEISPRQSVGIHGLRSSDKLDFASEEGKRLDTEYGSSYIWLRHRTILGEALFVDSTASATRAEHDRRGFERDEERGFDVRDERDLNATELGQSWNLRAGRSNFFNAGVEYRKIEAVYDYSGFRDFTTPLAAVRAEPREGFFSLNDRLASENISLHASDRIRPLESVTLEIGLRYDRFSLLNESVLSPRVSAAWGFGTASVLRAAWGRFSQSHRPYELMVEDGDARTYRAERSQHWVIGFEQLFKSTSRGSLDSLRIEAYRRPVRNPRPRYENLFEAFDPFPEGNFDRVRIEPESSLAEGVELLARGRATTRLDWLLNYALASTTDRIDGQDVPRRTDQRHTVNLDANYRVAAHWNLNLALNYRSAWPTTPLTLEHRLGSDGNPESVPVLGAVNSERLPGYGRLDLRVSREWQKSGGALSFFFDAHNLSGRRNVAGLDVAIDAKTGELTIQTEQTPRFIASAGIVWVFR